MPDQLFTKYVGSPIVILAISHGDWGNKSYLDGCGYLGIERAYAGGRRVGRGG
jgi:hypothetical protein